MEKEKITEETVEHQPESTEESKEDEIKETGAGEIVEPGVEGGVGFGLEGQHEFELLGEDEVGVVAEEEFGVLDEEESEMGSTQEYEGPEYQQEYFKVGFGEEEMLGEERDMEGDMEGEEEGEGGGVLKVYKEIQDAIGISPPLDTEAKRRKGEEDYAYGRLSRGISGDFAKISYPLKPLLMDIIEEEVLQEPLLFAPFEYKPVPTGISDYKERLMDRCIKLQQKKLTAQVRHGLLQITLAKYYKRRRMEFCLRELGDTSDLEYKYNKKLEEFASFLHVRKFQQENVTAQLENLTKVRTTKVSNFENSLNDFHNYLAQVGRGLIYAKKGYKISDRLIDHWLYRRKLFTTNMSKLRYEYIRHNDAVAQMEDELRRQEKLDELGDSYYTLGYFEKLKAENRSYCDKIEEKETELVKVRKSLQNSVLISSHMREKSTCLAHDIMDLRMLVSEYRDVIEYTRYNLSILKSERDSYRSKTESTKNEAGLLLHPELVEDLEHAKNQKGILEKEFEVLKSECVKVIRQIRNARKTREAVIELKRKGVGYGTKIRSISISEDKELTYSPSRSMEKETNISRELQLTVKKLELNN